MKRFTESLPALLFAGAAIPMLIMGLDDQPPTPAFEWEAVQYDPTAGTATQRSVYTTGERALHSIVSFHCNGSQIVEIQDFTADQPDAVGEWPAPKVCDPVGNSRIEPGELG